jgi:hypothetical protein
MANATKYYSPRLYHEAKAQRIRMTVLTNQLVESGLYLLGAGATERSIVAEEPPVRDPAWVDLI